MDGCGKGILHSIIYFTEVRFCIRSPETAPHRCWAHMDSRILICEFCFGMPLDRMYAVALSTRTVSSLKENKQSDYQSTLLGVLKNTTKAYKRICFFECKCHQMLHNINQATKQSTWSGYCSGAVKLCNPFLSRHLFCDRLGLSLLKRQTACGPNQPSMVIRLR